MLPSFECDVLATVDYFVASLVKRLELGRVADVQHSAEERSLVEFLLGYPGRLYAGELHQVGLGEFFSVVAIDGMKVIDVAILQASVLQVLAGTNSTDVAYQQIAGLLVDCEHFHGSGFPTLTVSRPRTTNISSSMMRTRPYVAYVACHVHL